MPVPLLVTVLVGVGLASDPSVVAMRDAMVEALGPEAVVRVQETAEPASAAQLVAAHQPPIAVVWVDWTDSQRHEVVLHMRRNSASEWRERTLRFQDSDATQERGRTMGFVLASILRPESALAIRSAPKPMPQPQAATGLERPWAIEVMAIASTGIRGTAGGMGAAFAARRYLYPWLGLRLGLAARVGEVSGAAATSLSSRATLGACARWRPARRLSLGGRLDGALYYENVSRSADGETARRGRFLPGAALMLESAFSPALATELVLNIGFDMAFGQTSIYVDDRRVTDLAALRGVAEAGLRVSF
jgi:hypothetical protein